MTFDVPGASGESSEPVAAVLGRAEAASGLQLEVESLDLVQASRC